MTEPANHNDTAAKPRRRRFQFSLRTFFVFVTLVAVIGGWFAIRLNTARRQEAAVKALVSMGGRVCYDYQMKANNGAISYDDERLSPYSVNSPIPGPPAPPPSAPWLREWLGTDFLHRVVGVEARTTGTPTPDEIAAHAAKLPDLVELTIASNPFPPLAPITRPLPYRMKDHGIDVGRFDSLHRLKRMMLWGIAPTNDNELQPLAKLPALEELTINFKNWPSAEQISGLSGAAKLRYLRLENIDVLGKNVQLLRHLPELTTLELTGSIEDSETIGTLGALPRLEVLAIQGWIGQEDFSVEQQRDLGSLRRLKQFHLRNASMVAPSHRPIAMFPDPTAPKFVRHFKELQELYLIDHSRVDDDALQYIAGLKNLEKLDLSRCKVTSKGLAHLTGLSKLKTLVLDNNHGIDDVAIESLQKMKTLRELGLSLSSVSESGRAALHTAIPGLLIDGEPASQPGPTPTAP